MTKAPRYGSLPPCYGSIRHPHTRAENCCHDCPFEAPCDRLAEERGEHNRALAGKAAIEERARIVAWLRINQDPNSYDVTNEIERGDHLEGKP